MFYVMSARSKEAMGSHALILCYNYSVNNGLVGYNATMCDMLTRTIKLLGVVIVVVAVLGFSMAYSGFSSDVSQGVDREQVDEGEVNILIGVSLAANDPDAVAVRIAATYGGEIVGVIREVREYQIRLPAESLNDGQRIFDAIALDPDVVFTV